MAGLAYLDMCKNEHQVEVMDLGRFYSGKKVLITGGLGFIGSNLAHRLVSYGADVLIIDSLIPEYGGNWFNIQEIRDKVTVNISDLRDKYSMNYLVQGRDLIFNLAGTLSHVDSITDPFTDLEINCVSQLSLLEACKNYNPAVKVLFTGTRSQYGRPKRLPVREDTPMYPTDVNGINKIAGELYHLVYNDVFGIRTTSLRLVNTFGPRHQMKHHKQGILNWFIRQIMEGKTIKLYGTGSQIRDTNYIDDVVDALLLGMSEEKTNGKAYNLGGFPISLREFVEKALAIYGAGEYEVIPFPEDAKRIEIGDYIADYSKFSKDVGWKPRIDVEEGIRRTFDFYEKYKQYYW